MKRASSFSITLQVLWGLQVPPSPLIEGRCLADGFPWQVWGSCPLCVPWNRLCHSQCLGLHFELSLGCTFLQGESSCVILFPLVHRRWKGFPWLADSPALCLCSPSFQAGGTGAFPRCPGAQRTCVCLSWARRSLRK